MADDSCALIPRANLLDESNKGNKSELIFGLSEYVKGEYQDYIEICCEDCYVIRLVEKYLNFSYSLRLINMTTAGERLANGQVTGLLGLLQTNAVDLILESFVIDYERYSFQRFFALDLYKANSLIYQPINYRESDWLRFFTLFPWSIWLLILSSYLIMVILNSIKTNPIRNMLDYYGIFLMRSVYLVENKSKILLITWLLSCFILFQLFSVNFLSILLVNKETPINSLKDVIDLDLNLLVEKDSYQYCKMKDESWSIWPKVITIVNARDYKHFDNRKNILMTHSSMSKAIEEINQGSNLKRTEGNGSFSLSGYPFNKNLNQGMKQKLHLFFQRIKESKLNDRELFKHVIREERMSMNISKDSDLYNHGDSFDGVIQVSLDNIYFIFSILSIGFCFSLLILVIEKVMESLT